MNKTKSKTWGHGVKRGAHVTVFWSFFSMGCAQGLEEASWAKGGRAKCATAALLQSMGARAGLQ